MYSTVYTVLSPFLGLPFICTTWGRASSSRNTAWRRWTVLTPADSCKLYSTRFHLDNFKLQYISFVLVTIFKNDGYISNLFLIQPARGCFLQGSGFGTAGVSINLQTRIQICKALLSFYGSEFSTSLITFGFGSLSVNGHGSSSARTFSSIRTLNRIHFPALDLDKQRSLRTRIQICEGLHCCKNSHPDPERSSPSYWLASGSARVFISIQTVILIKDLLTVYWLRSGLRSV